MSDKSNNLFVWKNYKGFISKDENKDIANLKYWQSKTAEVTDNAIKNVLLTSNFTDETNKSLVDDTVYNEAKSLVKGWLTNKKVYGDFSDRQSFLHLSGDEADYSVPTRTEIHKEWEHLVQKIETKEDYKAELDDYLTSDRDHLKEDKTLKSIMSNLHKKTFVDSSKLSKLDSSKSVDMKKRIENRQEEVKRKRDERNKKEEIMRLEKLAEKEARIEAMKMLKEEKKMKELSIKKEEELLQIEMNKIRYELQKKREQDMLEQKKLKETRELLKNQEKQTNSSRKLEEATEKLQSKINKNTNERFEIIADLVEKKFLNKNLQLIRKCFRAWKNELENYEIKMEKAKVWFDFKNSRKVFRAWCNYSRFIKFNMQIDIEQQRIKLLQMKENMASEFFKRNLLKKYILHWSLYVIDEKESRWCQKLEEMRKKKMVDYISALQEKALENQEKLENLQSVSNTNKIRDTNFDQTLSQITYTNENTKLSARKDLPLQSQCKSARPLTSSKRPKEAWQVTKKDVYLPLDKLIDNLSQERKSLESPNYRKSLKPPKVINSYACRDAAQKELIKQQQVKIKEQQRLIEEIKTNNLLKNIKENQQFSILNSEMDNQNSGINSASTIDRDDLNSQIPDLQNTKYRNKFVIQMEARTKERERIKAERLEKQRVQEEEKKKKT